MTDSLGPSRNSNAPPNSPMLEISALSRKKQSSSVGRHFSYWKLRRFVLDEKDGKLFVHSQSQQSKPVIIDLKNASILNHHYISKTEMPDGHIVSIVENGLEIVMKFDSVKILDQWVKLLSDTAAKKKHISQEESNRVIHAFGLFFKERMKLLSSSSSNDTSTMLQLVSCSCRI